MAAPRTIALDKSTAARYAQLTYTSFDNGTGRGGWQVKQQIGDLDAAEAQLLTSRIVTRFDLVPVMPDFPTPEQTAARPARLSYAAVPALGHTGIAAAAYWHTVDAGRDASGRPGNVFAHVLLDRDPSAASPVRPIELWRSVGWLRPYGVPEVAAAELTSEYPPVANPAMSAASIVDFLLAHHVDRQSVFRVMLDAVAGALAGGPALVLLTDDHDEAASWIAALSHFMSPCAARRLAFSTHDGPEAAVEAVELGFHVVVVPRARIEAKWEVPGAVIVDVAEQPNLGDFTRGLAHRVARASIAVTPWSALAEGVLSDDEVAGVVLARQDEIAAELGDTGAIPAWSLALAAIGAPDLAEFATEAQRIIADGGTDQTASVPWASELVAQAQERFPLTAAEALDRLRTAVSGAEPDTGAAARRLLRAILDDSSWLAEQTVHDVPIVGTLIFDADIVKAFDRRCAALRDRASADGVVVEALRLAELVERLTAPDDAALPTVRAELLSVINLTGVGFLWDATGWVSSAEAAALSVDVRARFVRPFVAQEPATSIATLAALPARWLFAVPTEAGPRFELPANPTEYDHYLFPLVVRTVLAYPRWTIPADVRRFYVLDAVRLAVDCARFDDASCRELVAALVDSEVPDANELIALSNAHPSRVPPAVLATMVFHGAGDDGLFRTVVDASDADATLIAAASLRGWYRSGRVPPAADWVHDVEVLGAGDNHAWVASAAADLVAMLAAGSVVATQGGSTVCAPASTFLRALSGRIPALTTQVAELTRASADAGQLDMNWVAAQSFLRSMRLPHTVTVFDNPVFTGRRWEDAVLREAIDAGTYRGPRTAAELRDTVWPTISTTSADAAERFFAGYREAARTWLAALGLSGEHPGRRRNRDDYQ
ncbi:hypothetical protein GOEFS_096_00800 [Gordonia effusa NBRC 100432]|uniref:Uncharacterized protein n=1 Tax=Gordonia effusa NBRC 100432 TaxID=1077974 RepID=H0R4A2_9ACTN|nr:hypothetical protein [Gordonia effusa]GAB19903.1 hypothetical protein GOEFS_096_00800 [Gordonia effusa NBRC 100432]